MKPLAGSLALVVAAGAPSPGDPPRRAWDFAYDVLPILQRQGCSSAYCHGSATGRGGLQLSLFGGDAAADHAALAAQFGGRRLDHRDPDQSLVLQKALGRLDHGGGRRLPRDGAAHRTLREWIADGAPWRTGAGRELLALALERRGDRIGALATFRERSANGAGQQETAQDVTDLALFSSTAPTVVDVDDAGRLLPRGPGEAHVVARFGNQTAVLRLVQPFARADDAAPAAPDAPQHPLDAAWLTHVADLGLAPAAPVSWSALARRLHLDLVGRPPTPRELDAFVADPDVPATVAGLVARAEFAAVWGEHLADWFEVPQPTEASPRAADAAVLRRLVVQAVARGDSLPAIARQVVSGSLGVVDRLPDPRDRAEYVGRTLLGMRLGCARCHDHPSDRWRAEEHLAFSACFANPRPDGAGGMTAGVLFDPDSGEAVAPRLLALAPTARHAPPGSTRREDLAAFVVSREHDRLAANLCNRVFATLSGRGLVEPVDDHRPGNPPQAPAMLAALVDAFHRSGGSLGELVAFVATSRFHAAACDERAGPAASYLAAAISRPLSGPAFARAVHAVVGRPPLGELPPTPLARELALRNGELLHGVLAAGGTTVDATFHFGGSPRERLVELWRTVLSRSPRPDEEERFLPLCAADLAAFRDLAYALLAGREFGHRR